MGVHLRARESAEGYDVRIRYGKDDTIKKSTVRVGDVPIGTRGTLRRVLICAGCNKPTTKNLYLGGDFRFFCSRCLGVDPWKVRVPMKWPLEDEVKFRQLLRRKVDQDILTFELAALRTLTPEEFFRSRPYLVPEWVDRVKPLDASLHHRMLKVMHQKYRMVMMKRRVRYLSERETEWLMDRLQMVFEKASVITKKEITWLRNRTAQLRSREGICTKSTATGIFNTLDGSQSGTRLDQSASPPLVTDCSSKKTSSEADTNAKPVEAAASGNAPNATAKEPTTEASESSSAANATEE